MARVVEVVTSVEVSGAHSARMAAQDVHHVEDHTMVNPTRIHPPQRTPLLSRRTHLNLSRLTHPDWTVSL